jgi:CRISPR-associated endoribonuclease Cas6
VEVERPGTIEPLPKVLKPSFALFLIGWFIVGSLTIVDFVLRAVSGGGLPWFVGHECRGAFLGLVSGLDSSLAHVLHEGVDGRSVFSIKPLLFVSGFAVVFPDKRLGRFPVEGNVVFEPGAKAGMSVVLLNEELAGRLVPRLIGNPQSLRLVVKNYEFMVENLRLSFINPVSIMSAQDAVDELDVEFVTPTYFNPLRGDMSYKVLYPDPTLLLASLISIAHQLTGASYPKPEELASHVYVSGLDIKTPYIREVTKEAPTGFVGWAKIRFRKTAPPETRKLVLGLLKLGEITNVGGNRSGGYGVIKLKIQKEKQEKQSAQS